LALWSPIPVSAQPSPCASRSRTQMTCGGKLNAEEFRKKAVIKSMRATVRGDGAADIFGWRDGF